MELIERLQARRLCFTVTAGRSGTRLLTELLRQSAGLCAEHEPAPRTNYVLRSLIDCPGAAAQWLLSEKLPAIDAAMDGRMAYAELSHLSCKALVEPLLGLGLRPVFLMLSRDPRAVASSLFALDVVPGRTEAGRLVLIEPRQSAFLPLADAERWSDYQLCYWYALEIEARQRRYRALFDAHGIAWMDCSFDGLRDWTAFQAIACFVAGEAIQPDRALFDAVLSRNQNPRGALLDQAAERTLPGDLDGEEAQLRSALRGAGRAVTTTG